MHDSTFEYLLPTDDQKETMRVVRINFKSLCDVITKMVPDGRYKALTITALEEAAMWANKGITRDSTGAPINGATIPLPPVRGSLDLTAAVSTIEAGSVPRT